jgi:hypothetical protein
MRAERQLLRLGEYLVGRACRRLPKDIGEERYREWAAELPAILHDPQIRLAPRRAVRMLGYAADTFRGTALTNLRARRQTPAVTAALSVLLVAGLVLVSWDIWNIVRAPDHPLNYLRLAWSLLLVANPIGTLLRSGMRVATLIAASGAVAVSLGDAGAGTSGLGELFCGGIPRPCPPSIVARQPMGPHQTDIMPRRVKLGLGHQAALVLTAMNSGGDGSSWSLPGMVLRPIS